MEQFQLLAGDRTLKASREQINNALLTVRSLSSGTTFPTTDLTDGMLCYRTDHGRLYQLADARNNIWTDRIAMSIAGTANTADSITWANIVGKPTAYPAEEHAHTYAGSLTEGGPATKAESLATPRTINGTPFDGTEDITIVNTIEQGGTGATTAQDALINLGAFPSTGGIIEGVIQKGSTEEEFLLLGGTTLLNGSLLALRGEDYPNANGTFVLSARNSSGLMSDLVGYPDGGLFWKNMLLTHAGHIYSKGSITPNEDIYLPSGGTWLGLWVYSVANNSAATTSTFYLAGGSHVLKLPSNLSSFSLFAIRVV